MATHHIKSHHITSGRKNLSLFIWFKTLGPIWKSLRLLVQCSTLKGFWEVYDGLIPSDSMVHTFHVSLLKIKINTTFVIYLESPMCVCIHLTENEITKGSTLSDFPEERRAACVVPSSPEFLYTNLKIA